MKIATLALLLVLGACGDDDDVMQEATESGAVDAHLVDAGLDASIDAHANPPGSQFVAGSLRTWQELARQNPGAYWYEEENCLINGRDGSSSIVQVDAQGARVVGRRSFPRSECIAHVNRFGRLEATFPELYEMCGALLQHRSNVTFSWDTRGVINACWVGDAPNCRDNCGEGFALRGWGFGSAPAVDASVPPDAG